MAPRALSAMTAVALLAAAGLLCISGSAEARNLLGAAPYVQCGGSGGECKSVCKDQVWGTVKCQSNFTCRRLNQWYWQCDKPGLPGSTPSAEPGPKPGPKPSPKPTYTPADFKQCGGSGNNCQGSKCKDARWPGVSCKPGLKCFRISQYYRGCDVRQPAAPAPGAYKQCGGLNGGGCEKNKTCADAPWKGHTCPKMFSCYRANKWYWQCDTKPITDGGK